MMNFRNYSNLTHVTIPDNIILSTNDFSNCFNGLKNLKTVEFNQINITNIAAAY